MPSRQDAFVVVDGQMLVQGVSRRAERLLSITEDMAVNRPLSELLVSADAEAGGRGALSGAIVEAVGGSDDSARAVVRPLNTFGVRMRARIAPCGPPRAALIVLEDSPGPTLRAVPGA
jgi:PAS domain-containing protein